MSSDDNEKQRNELLRQEMNLMRQWYETENNVLKYYGQTERQEEDRLQSVLH